MASPHGRRIQGKIKRKVTDLIGKKDRKGAGVRRRFPERTRFEHAGKKEKKEPPRLIEEKKNKPLLRKQRHAGGKKKEHDRAMLRKKDSRRKLPRKEGNRANRVTTDTVPEKKEGENEKLSARWGRKGEAGIFQKGPLTTAKG